WPASPISWLPAAPGWPCGSLAFAAAPRSDDEVGSPSPARGSRPDVATRSRVAKGNMTVRAVVLCLLAIIATPASAQPPDTVLLEELTWTELRALVQAGKTTMILPIGGTEQNGFHMALGKHNVRVKLLAERIARALGDALVAPVPAYVPEGGLNPPTGHMRFPGTITVSEDVFRGVLESAGRSFRLHGVRHVVFLGDHGSTQAGEKAVAARLNREWQGTPARAHAI